MFSKMSIYFLIILIILPERELIRFKHEICDEELRNVGTILFGVDETCSDCVSKDDASLLKARQEFDLILPFTKDIVMSEKSIAVLIEYFYGANEIIQKMSCGNDKVILMRAYFDTVGGYLNHYLIPVTKFSFYAGEISLRTVKFIIDLLEHAKNFLNTNGLGWAEPINEFKGFTYKIEPLRISLNDPNCDSGKIERRNDKPSSCVALILINDENSEEDIIVSLPKVEIEENGMITNMWLPYKRKHIFNLQSKTSAYILLKYYVDVTKCYKFQDISQETFNKKFSKWLGENIVPHLFNGKDFYPALGAVLRILETVKTGNGSIMSGNQLIDQVNHKPPMQQLGDTDEELSKISNQVQSIAAAQNSNIFTRFFGKKNTLSKADEDRVQKDIIKLLLIILLMIFIVVIVMAFICQKRKTDKICEQVLNREMPFYKKCLGKLSNSTNVQHCDEVDIKCDSSAISGGPSPRHNEPSVGKPRKSGCCPISSCFANDKKKKIEKREKECPQSARSTTRLVAKCSFTQKPVQRQPSAHQLANKKVCKTVNKK